MRGKAHKASMTLHRSGITPAYAGKSERLFVLCEVYKDHPRLCGEKFHLQISGISSRGSPPPMRGKVILNHLEPLSRRITPAYAGKSLFTPFAKSWCKDHPRLCGEKSVFRSWKTRFRGSPPPMRGKVYNSSRVEQRNRITPAYAGKSIENNAEAKAL